MIPCHIGRVITHSHTFPIDFTSFRDVLVEIQPFKVITVDLYIKIDFDKIFNSVNINICRES